MKTPFSTLPPNVYPVFLDGSIIKLPKGDISRLQLSIIIDFALAEYKLQSVTFDSTIIDLKYQSKRGTTMHRRFYSTYVLLSRLLSFADLDLLYLINIMDINNQPHPQFYDKDLRLDNVSHITSDAWEKDIKAKKL